MLQQHAKLVRGSNGRRQWSLAKTPQHVGIRLPGQFDIPVRKILIRSAECPRPDLVVKIRSLQDGSLVYRNPSVQDRYFAHTERAAPSGSSADRRQFQFIQVPVPNVPEVRSIHSHRKVAGASIVRPEIQTSTTVCGAAVLGPYGRDPSTIVLAFHTHIHIKTVLGDVGADKRVRDPRPVKRLHSDRKQQSAVVEMAESRFPRIIVLPSTRHISKPKAIDFLGVACIDHANYKFILSRLDRALDIEGEGKQCALVSSHVFRIEPRFYEVVRALEVNA